MLDERYCLHCAHWTGTERDVVEQWAAACTAPAMPAVVQTKRGPEHHFVSFADETCDQYRDAARKVA